jgi:hypothetical protein
MTPSSNPMLPPASLRTIFTTNSDDDGEKYAGKRLEKFLAEMDVEGVIVVARWYGGVLLGPVRFAHIENVASQAIERWRKGAATDSNGGGAKRAKLEVETPPVDDEVERARLAKILGDRDQSITVLRELLADKTKKAAASLASGPSQPPASSASTTTTSRAKKLDYTEMPVARLKQLEKAKDASIAFILKQIDKVEEEEKAREIEAIANLNDAGDLDDDG